MTDETRTPVTDDLVHLDQAIVLLDHVARRSESCAASINAATATQLLVSLRPPGARSNGRASVVDDQTALRAARHALAQLSDGAMRDDRIADAVHHALLAHLAAG
jgi:hypothetical protein